ncbi:MAG: LysM peptidoglycan-binding domain-containing protein [Shimia sp.]
MADFATTLGGLVASALMSATGMIGSTAMVALDMPIMQTPEIMRFPAPLATVPDAPEAVPAAVPPAAAPTAAPDGSAPAEGDAPALADAPEAPGAVDVATLPLEGPTPPRFDIVDIAADGSGIVAGTAPDGTRITLILDGEILAEEGVGARGQFVSFVALPPADANRTLTLLMETTGGREVPSEQTIVIGPIAAAPSSAPVPMAEAAPDAPPARMEVTGGTLEVADAPALSDDAPAEPVAPGMPGALAEAPLATDAPPTTARVDGPTLAPSETVPILTETEGGRAAAAAIDPPEAVASAAPLAPPGSGAGVAPRPPAPGAEPASVARPDAPAATEIAQAPSVAPAEPDRAAQPGAGGDAPDQAALPPEIAPQTSIASLSAPGAPGAAPNVGQADAAPRQAPQILLADADGLRVLQGPEVTSNVALDTITYDDTGDVALGGRGAGAGFVRVYIDDQPVTTSRIGADGAWRTALPDVDTGVYTLRIDEVTPEGDVASRIETPFLREDPEAVVALAEGSDATTGPIEEALLTVQPGATLWAIARDRYGEGQLYVKLFEANRDRIRDPDLIYPGQVFDIPD